MAPRSTACSSTHTRRATDRPLWQRCLGQPAVDAAPGSPEAAARLLAGSPLPGQPAGYCVTGTAVLPRRRQCWYQFIHVACSDTAQGHAAISRINETLRNLRHERLPGFYAAWPDPKMHGEYLEDAKGFPEPAGPVVNGQIAGKRNPGEVNRLGVKRGLGRPERQVTSKGAKCLTLPLQNMTFSAAQGSRKSTFLARQLNSERAALFNPA